MTGDGGEATRLIEETIDYPHSGRVAHISIWAVPSSDAYPDGVKYRMHYGDTHGNTILRYDNSHPETKGHERHVGDTIDSDYEYPGNYVELLRRFRREVTEHEQA